MKKMKKCYCVIARRIDCGDDDVFQLETDGRRDFFPTKADARRAMKADYLLMTDEYSTEWSADGKTNPCRRKVEKDEIFLDIPVWNGDKMKEDWIQCHWKIVEI